MPGFFALEIIAASFALTKTTQARRCTYTKRQRVDDRSASKHQTAEGRSPPMKKRSQRRTPNPDNPADWIGQPYVPQMQHFPVRQGPAPLNAFVANLIRHPNRRGCLWVLWLVVGIALAWLALIGIGFIQDNGLGFWVLLVLIGAAIAGTLAGTAAARRRQQGETIRQRHHHHQY
jgi:hypothetical protein